MEKLSRREFFVAAGIGGLFVFCAMLAVALLLVVGGVVPLGQKPAAVTGVVTRQPITTPPRDVEAEPPTQVPEEVPKWVEELGQQMAEHELLAERQRIAEHYVQRALAFLDKGLGPGVIADYPDLTIFGDTMQAGDVGTFGRIEVMQILGPLEFLAKIDGETVFVNDFSTAGLVDGRAILPRKQVFFVVGPKTYKSVLGARTTVMEIRPIDTKEARVIAAEKVKAIMEARRPQKNPAAENADEP